jgi:hypothetical protein
MATLPALLNMALTKGRIARADAEARQEAWRKQAYAVTMQNRFRNMALENASVSR